jgi:predicted metal-binding membrane protein
MFLGGWAVMVGVGMVPGTLPAARLVGGTRGSVNGTVFLLGYCTLWLVLGLLGYVVLTPFSTALGEIGAGALLVAAAVYELSPLKDACLRRCRSPVRLLFYQSFAGGISHGLDCAGCCVFLMALMVGLGLMSVWWALMLAVVVAVQKAGPFGARSSGVLAAALASAAAIAWI